VLAVLAVVAALLARDVHRWDAGALRGDVAFATEPSGARWHADAVLPGDPAYRLLAIGSDLAYRRALQRFLAVEHAPASSDQGVTSARARGDVEATLAAVTRGTNAVQAARAANLLGILAFADAIPSGPAQPAPVESSIANFRAAVRADPGEDDAKFNLELVLRLLQTRGSGANANTTEGVQRGRQGASGAISGRGY
jgi:hypothetical protein